MVRAAIWVLWAIVIVRPSWHERLGKSADEIAAEYDLTLSDLYAALTYYFDHRKEIDARITEDDAFVETLRASTPSKQSQKLRSLGGEN